MTELTPEVDIVLPDLGGRPAALTVWFARPGDRVFAGERVAEVAIDGATFEVAAPVDGTLIALAAYPRDRVAAGQRLGSIRPDPEE
jgi:pyruvate/2-oxoglutarate dehydrogenase complex dihydrolipoamide acyltransferase (E2) component